MEGVYPPIPLSIFGQNDFPLRGEGGTPQFRQRKKLLKTVFFGQKTPILALFDAFFEENFRRFSVKGGGTVVQDPEIANFWFKPCIAIFNIH